MHPNARTIETFYRAFQELDSATMAGIYHPEATFADPVFELKGDEIGDMWRMFCSSGDDLRVTFSDPAADDAGGTARWEARYAFKPTGRPVHNVIDAAFIFRDGLVIAHNDTFDLASWARQALGLSGALLGRTGFMHKRIRQQARGQLSRFQSRSA
ncbi:MAG: nuclear transport factor 2 family protein [Acidimicrobiia bacterium]